MEAAFAAAHLPGRRGTSADADGAAGRAGCARRRARHGQAYDGLGYLSGRTLEEVERAGFEALCAAQAERDVPIAVLELEQVDAYHLGELFYFLELSSAICALADGVDPFTPVTFPAREDAARALGKTEETEA